MKRLILSFSVFLLINFTLSLHAQVSDAQALFIYNFSRLVEWPEEVKSGDFIIGIYGKSDIEVSLKSFVSNKKVGSQNVVVKTFNDVNEISQCHILFVSSGKSSSMLNINNAVGKGTLIVGEKQNLVNDGAAISFLIVDNKLKFRLKEENALKYDLKVSKSLKNMALI